LRADLCIRGKLAACISSRSHPGHNAASKQGGLHSSGENRTLRKQL
jgi:hypothetical protein